MTARLFLAMFCVVLSCAAMPADAAGPPRPKPGQGQASGAGGPPRTTPATPGTARLAQIKGVAAQQSRGYKRAASQEASQQRRFDRLQARENQARSGLENARSRHGEGTPEYRAARNALRSATVARANAGASLDSAKQQAQQSRRQLREANRALSRARKGDWPGAQRAMDRVDQRPPGRARAITFDSRVQVATVSMAPEVVAARKGQLRPKR